MCLVASGSCTDAVTNAAESDVDCGGPVCPRCLAGLRCEQGADCLEAVCTLGFCAARPSCTDALRNGDEADVDCGGSLCARCQVGATCSLASDCFTGLCTSGRCVGPPDCTDGLRNGTETDVDCGGPICTARCGLALLCSSAGDCLTARCSDKVIQSDTTWKMSPSAPAGWNTTGFNDSGWLFAVSEGLHGTGAPWGSSPPMPPQTSAHWLWSYDSRNGSDANTVYFRKTFIAPPGPIELHVAADDRFTAYLDGVSVASGVLWFTPAIVVLAPTPGATTVLAVSVINGGGTGGLVLDGRMTQARCAP